MCGCSRVHILNPFLELFRWTISFWTTWRTGAGGFVNTRIVYMKRINQQNRERGSSESVGEVDVES